MGWGGVEKVRLGWVRVRQGKEPGFRAGLN